MPLKYTVVIEKFDDGDVVYAYEFDAEFITHKWTNKTKHAENELQVGREWKIIKTQKHFWAISDEIGTSPLNFLLKAYKDHSKFPIEIELWRYFIDLHTHRAIDFETVAKLNFVALIKSYRRDELNYHAFYFQIIDHPVETDEPE
jgi:hypothetical protein